MCQVKWYEVWAYRLQSPNEGGGDRPRPFIIVAIWAGFMLAENCENTVKRAHVSSSIGAFILGSLSFLPMVNGGDLLSPQERRFLLSDNSVKLPQ